MVVAKIHRASWWILATTTVFIISRMLKNKSSILNYSFCLRSQQRRIAMMTSKTFEMEKWSNSLEWNYQVPVVQSIVSLTSLVKCQIVNSFSEVNIRHTHIFSWYQSGLLFKPTRTLLVTIPTQVEMGSHHNFIFSNRIVWYAKQ